MLSRRLRRRININTTLGQHLLFAWRPLPSDDDTLSQCCPDIQPPWGHIPANTSCCTNAGLMLGHRLRRWPNIKSALVQRLLFAKSSRID